MTDHNLENSLVSGATGAYEKTNVAPYPEWVLDEVCENLGTALYWEWQDKIAFALSDDIVVRAMSAIDDCALGNPSELLTAVKAAVAGNGNVADDLLERYIRTYAEAHLPDLVEYFQIDVGRKV